MNPNADGELRKLINCVIKYNDFLYPDTDTVPISNPENVSIVTLIRKFDTMQYFGKEGSKVFPNIYICHLTRIHFGKFSNA